VGPFSRFGEECISFEDPNGLGLELVFAEGGELAGSVPERDGVPRESAVRRIAGVTIDLRDIRGTEELLSGVLGIRQTGREGDRTRFTAGEGASASAIDVRTFPGTGRGVQSAGSVHHIACRTPSGEEQREWRGRLIDAGLSVTEVLDRKYFQSIYFREPGGVLFEIATDPPGFTVDEPLQALGTGLKLPDWLEPERGRIERILPPLIHTVPGLPPR
jgi:glyoxalase family protein